MCMSGSWSVDDKFLRVGKGWICIRLPLFHTADLHNQVYIYIYIRWIHFHKYRRFYMARHGIH